MGITWRGAMPMLSTLAALVIIVSSAEDHLERDYRYDLRPRALDNPTNYDQPWRAIEADQIMQPSTQTESWHDPVEEPLKRRRPFRKRKRRPISNEDSTPAERQMYPEQAPQFQEQQYAETTETPRRRRKKLENRRNQWTDDYVEPERPFRKRRKKRPSINTWRLSEFDDRTQDTDGRQLEEDVKDIIQSEFIDGYSNYPQSSIDEHKLKEFIQEEFGDGAVRVSSKEPERSNERDDLQLKEDKSLSEFSMEVPRNRDDSEENGKTIYLEVSEANKYDEKASRVELPERPILISSESNKHNIIKSKLSEQLGSSNVPNSDNNLAKHQKSRLSSFKTKNDSTIDPDKLKELLKQSNATSLSEILQKHNLSLSDLLSGRGKALSILKSEQAKHGENDDKIEHSKKSESVQEPKDSHEDKPNQTLESKSETDTATEDAKEHKKQNEKEDDLEPQNTGKPEEKREQISENGPKIVPKRRFPGGLRRKLRLRPTINQNNLKGQPNRDLIAQTARRYHNNRNITKSREWKDVITTMNMTNNKENNNINDDQDISTTTTTPEETTTVIIEIDPSTIAVETETFGQEEEKGATEIPVYSTEEPVQETTTNVPVTTTKETHNRRPGGNRMGSRRHPNSNRQKAKRKHKTTTTEPSVHKEELIIDLLGMPNLVSSSEFIARTESPNEDAQSTNEFKTTDDTFVTEQTRKKSTRNPTFSTTPKYAERNLVRSTTEETAKFEIEEILNDTMTRARLSKILMERNMTLNELFEHRERGSSHVHLADIFHNASKEPNPPEPFLSKSSIAPLAKGTYPLRALLDAKHDSKITTMDPNYAQGQYVNIPVVMDFGNNVNENGENMGIMSLFNKLAADINAENSAIKKDSEGTPYVSTIISETNSITNDTVRESRVLKDEGNNLKKDVVGWNELFELMRRSKKNHSDPNSPLPAEELLPTEPSKKIGEEDLDGDGVIVLEDLHMRNFNSKVAPELGEKININTYESVETPEAPGIFDRMPGNTRSVTVATASIVGLSMILFLLTYAAFKWKQQRKMLTKKHSFNDERIPTPVFESRKGHKNNCSTRSISPMLNTTNIYNMNTLDSQHGSESPDYMWDSLRKPFQ